MKTIFVIQTHVKKICLRILLASRSLWTPPVADAKDMTYNINDTLMKSS